jgi:hypothetical protein
MHRYEVRTEDGPAQDGLYELEQTTYYHVVDLQSNEVVMTFESQISATPGAGGQGWADYQHSGVSSVTIAPDGQSVVVVRHDGWEERVPLP